MSGTGIRIIDMPDLGAVTDTSSVVGEHAGSGRFGALAFKNYVAAGSVFVPVKQYGAVGDGVANDTAALQAALNAGGGLFVSPGTYMTDDLTISSPVTLYIMPGAILKQRTASTTSRWMFTFLSGSEGSVIYGGGTLDGNRDVLLTPTYTALNWLNLIFWGAVNNYQPGVNDITVSGLTIQNFASTVLFFGNTTKPCLVEDLSIISCGAGITLINCRQIIARNIWADHVGNGLINIYGELHLFGTLHDSSITDFVVTNYNPSVHNADPFGIAITFQDCYTSTFARLNVTGFIGVDTANTNQALGVLGKGTFGCAFDDIRVVGYVQGMQFQTAIDCTLDGLFCDGQYIKNTGSLGENLGIMIADGGEYSTASLSTFDRITVMTTRRTTVSNIVVTRCDEGLRIASQNVALHGAICNANTQYGMRLSQSFPPFNFPAQVRQNCRNVTLTDVTARLNGQSGLMITGSNVVSVGSGCDFTDNGTDTTTGDNFRAGILMYSDTNLAGDVKNVMVSSDIRIGDLQNWTTTPSSGVSYNPGASGASNYFTVTSLDPQWMELGQVLTFRNALGTSSDPSNPAIFTGDYKAKVVDIVGQDFIVQTDAPITWSATNNMTSLAGTASSSGQTITGSGTSFMTLPGAVWITNGSQWFQAVRAVSNTQLLVYPAPSPALSGASLSYLAIAVWGIPSERYGIFIDASVSGPIILPKAVNFLAGPSPPFTSVLAGVQVGNTVGTVYEGLTGNAVAAHPGGGSASATPLPGVVNIVSTCTTAGDSVMLPPAVRGAQVVVTNGTLNALAVFCRGPDNINFGTAGGSISVASFATALFYCAQVNTWFWK